MIEYPQVVQIGSKDLYINAQTLETIVSLTSFPYNRPYIGLCTTQKIKRKSDLEVLSCLYSVVVACTEITLNREP